MKPLSAKGGEQVKCHHAEFQFPYSTSEVPCQNFVILKGLRSFSRTFITVLDSGFSRWEVIKGGAIVLRPAEMF